VIYETACGSHGAPHGPAWLRQAAGHAD